MMNRKILALLLIIVVLAGVAGAAQVRGGNRFSATAEALSAIDYGPIPPLVSGQTSHSNYGVFASANGTAHSLAVVRSSVLNLAAASILSWTHKIKTSFDTRIVEETCLANAVYFEARSESALGQLAVATVILNRARSLNYPSSICGVVYQGASHLNACQFSFACDGKPDVPKLGRAWQKALAVTALALAADKDMEDEQMQIVATATHYHADYVEPSWSKSLHRLTKIGHHIFYS